MDEKLKIIGISGSLRKNSINTGLLRTAQEFLPVGLSLEIADISQIPLFNDDLAKLEFPQAVLQFQELVRGADGLLIATPEYNASIPGVLKNALDWASRPAQTQPFNGKPLAIMGAGGSLGTWRAQVHLRQVAGYFNMLTLNKPEVAISNAWEKFDAQGNLHDEPSRQKVRELIAALEQWVLRLAVQKQPA